METLEPVAILTIGAADARRPPSAKPRDVAGALVVDKQNAADIPSIVHRYPTWGSLEHVDEVRLWTRFQEVFTQSENVRYNC